MNEKLKKAFNSIKNDDALMEKFCKLKTLDEIIALAKENKIDITLEDLKDFTENIKDVNKKTKLDLSELKKVSGAGDICNCFVGGGGGKGEPFTCACVVGGGGRYNGITRCYCVAIGSGWSIKEKPKGDGC